MKRKDKEREILGRRREGRKEKEETKGGRKGREKGDNIDPFGWFRHGF